jgi:hypothetical protein
MLKPRLIDLRYWRTLVGSQKGGLGPDVYTLHVRRLAIGCGELNSDLLSLHFVHLPTDRSVYDSSFTPSPPHAELNITNNWPGESYLTHMGPEL